MSMKQIVNKLMHEDALRAEVERVWTERQDGAVQRWYQEYLDNHIFGHEMGRDNPS